MEEKFRELGYELTLAGDIPGFYTVIDTGREGPEVLILGELDSVVCPEHPDADKETGAVHSCGHHAQCAALLGIAAALKEDGVLDGLCGRIRLCAIPAEELLDLEFRGKLKSEGKIKYYGGKSEFLYRGYFDTVDIAFMVHTSFKNCVSLGSIGCVAKSITYKGKAAHAGRAPWDGQNALYAANCGLNAVNAIRETFEESDCIRVHPIITHGGDIVNAIPENVRLESYVRGKTFDAIKKANVKVNRALCGAALSLNTNIEINDIPGYAPLVNDRNMMNISRDAAEIVFPELDFKVEEQFFTESTDMGDISAVIPSVQPYISGAIGNAHGKNYEIADPETACVTCAKWQLVMLALLLENGAERAKKVIAEFKPAFATKADFFAYQDSFTTEGNRITYHESGKVEIEI
jgi:amidohydrolase